VAELSKPFLVKTKAAEHRSAAWRDRSDPATFEAHDWRDPNTRLAPTSFTSSPFSSSSSSSPWLSSLRVGDERSAGLVQVAGLIAVLI